jgi:hypothetical protein
MSSTSNSQNLLVNVFRPVYTYSAGSGFTPRLVVSNVDILSAGAVQTGNFQFGDANNNLFIGSNAGGGSNNASNVGIGVGAMNNKTNSTGTVAIGTNTLQGATAAVDTIAIGSEITGGGTSNVILGARSGTIGSNMILLGPGLATTGDVSGKLYIGQSNISNALIYGDFNQRYVGINRTDPTTNLDVSGDMRVTRWLSAGFSGAYSPQGAIDANGYVYASLGFRAQGGSAANPAFTFIDDSGTGFFQNDTSGFAISAKGVRIMDISADNTVYIYGNLKAFGSVNIGSVDTSSFVFSDGYVRDNAVNPVTDVSRAGIRTTTLDVSSLLQTSNGMFRVGPSGAPTVDISGSSIRAANIYGTSFVQSPFFHDAASTFDLSSGNLRVNSNIVVSNVLRTPAGAFRVGAITGPLTDISGGNIRTLGAVDISSGSVSRPSLGFVTDPSSGIHSGGTSILAFDTSGIQRMTLSNGNLGIGKATPVVALEVVGDVSATTYNGPGGTATDPHYTFSDDRKTGLFFPGANQIGFTAGSTERMRISNGFVGIGTTAPTTALEISGGALRITSASGGPIVLSNGQIDVSGVTVVSSTGVFSNAATTSNSIGGVVLSNSNAIVGGFLRNALTPSQFDISGGNISNSGRVTTSNILVSGYIRNALTPNVFDISTDISLSSGRFLGATNTSNSIGGVLLSNSILSNATVVATTAVRNALTPTVFDISTDISLSSGRFLGPVTTSNSIGGVILTNGIVRTNAGSVSEPVYTFSNATTSGLWANNSNDVRIALTGTDRFRIQTQSSTGASDTSATALVVWGTGLNTGVVGPVAVDQIVGEVGFRNGNNAHACVIRQIQPKGLNVDRNRIGFFTINGGGDSNLRERMSITYDGNVGIATADPSAQLHVNGGAIVSTFLRNALTPSQFDISGGNISNSGTTRSSNFITGTASSNSIGGVTLSNSSVSMANNTYIGWGIGTASTTGLYQPSANLLHLMTSASNRVTIASDGKVGIGTTAPAGLLDVSSTTSQPGILVQNGGLFLRGRPLWGQLFLYNATNQNALVIEDVSSGLRAVDNYPGITEAPLGWRIMTDGGNGSNKLLWQRVNGPGGSLSIPMALDICGNLGLGTTNPNARLSINGADASSGIMLTNGSANDATRAAGGGMVSNEIIGLTAAGQDAGQLRLSAGGGVNASSKTYIDMYGFNTRDMRLGTAGTERMRILSNGNVGIGTTTPATLLDVNGTIRGLSNVVAVYTTSNAGGSYTGATETDITTFTYTPKQSGSPRIIIQAYFEAYYPGLGGTENASVKLTDNANTELAWWFVAVDGNNSLGRNSRGSGSIVYHTTISGATTFKLRYTESGDDTLYVARIYIVVNEISTV